MLLIKFLGLDKHVRELTQRMDNIRQKISQPYELSIIDKPNEILEYDIKGIPSFIIDDRIITEGRMPTLEELEFVFNTYYSKMDTVNNTSNKKVLVPVDFSSTSQAAFRFAMEYGRIHNAQLDIIHVGSYRDPEMSMSVQHPDNLQKKRIQQLNAFISSQTSKEQSRPRTIYASGFPIDVINEYSKEYDLIIMGSTGEHGLADRLLGSISSGVAQRAHCPVMLIPKIEQHRDFKNILCAYHPGYDQQVVMEQLVSLLPEKLEHVHFVEILLDETSHHKADIGFIQGAIPEQYQHIHLHLDYIQGDSVIQGLNQYADENDIGAIVMMTQHRTSLEALFHKSQTKQMVMDIKYPLLVLHAED